MYWKQILASLLSALIVAVVAYQRGATVFIAFGVGTTIYVCTRWLMATVFRTQYWLSRGTGGTYTRRCPDCGTRIHRRSNDWLFECHECGWKAGKPVLRWVTQSVPARQLRRSITWWGFALIMLSVLLAGATYATGTSVEDVTGAVSNWSEDYLSEDTATAPAETGSTPGTSGRMTESSGGEIAPTEPAGQSSATRLNRTRIERKVHRFVNEERETRGLPRLSYDMSLATIARAHSEDMAEKQYFSHTEPDGDTIEDRYQEAGYNCHVQLSDHRYATGAENIAYTFAFKNVLTEAGTVSYDGNETRIARGLVRQWMNSKGHRENILTSYWNNEGIGVAIEETAEGIRVYATQNFC